jgi:hypothetical protein
LLAREQAIRAEAEIFRDANIARTQNLSLERVLETLLDFLSKLVPYDSALDVELRIYVPGKIWTHHATAGMDVVWFWASPWSAAA